MSDISLIFVTRRSRQLDAVYRELSELLVGLDEAEQDHWLTLIEEAPAVPGGRVVTVVVSDLTFLRSVQVGDAVCCYTDVTRVGRTSLTLDLEVWVLRRGQGDRVVVAEGEFAFVAIDENGHPRPITRRDVSSE